MFKPSSGPGGGIYTMEGAPTAWLPYIGVEDIRASTQKAVSLGAKVIVDVQEVPGHGWMSILVDPTGASIALWQPK
jgi:predicted enzyme related to lactoylglutathione lyase